MTDKAKNMAHTSLVAIENSGLIVIAIATTLAMIKEVMHMIMIWDVTLADLLLMFIYLEVLTMVGIYLESHRLPVRLPIYIAIVALARYLILDMKELEVWEMIAITAAALLLGLTVLVLRYGHVKFPYSRHE
ncbi:MAG: phosphate-starvation-inducible E [Gammaproteobacteria bacterium RBG_16_57_12]|nr:MAG: phosphate-starvation-inducible E [Gammaproteobacteria bacterium RBG_16_57_12]